MFHRDVRSRRPLIRVWDIDHSGEGRRTIGVQKCPVIKVERAQPLQVPGAPFSRLDALAYPTPSRTDNGTPLRKMARCRLSVLCGRLLF